MLILGIETSCDETATSVVEGKSIGTRNIVSVRSSIISSQINIHKKYGGVVPEVAAREHVLNILPVIDKAFKKAKIKRKDVAKKISAIAVSTGPGLITSLIAGIETAKTLSYVWNIPVIPINHIEGHIYANFIGKKQDIEFPAMVLTVSGGHTMLVLMKGHGKYKTIGETRDDAAGEAFDKAAKLLGLGYPGGLAIAVEAAKLRIKNQELRIKLPRPMINSNNYDFSFSGLKTALLYKIQENPNYKFQITNYAREFQQSVIDVLIHKTIKAAQEYKIKTIMLTGGVAANTELRKQMAKAVKTLIPDSLFLIPKLKYTTDNAAMIATAGYFKALRKDFTPWQKLKVDPNQRLK